MKLALLATFVSAAAAFAPAKQASTSTSLKAFEDALGAQPPVSSRVSTLVVPLPPTPRLTDTC